jgi:hypothetical protein
MYAHLEVITKMMVSEDLDAATDTNIWMNDHYLINLQVKYEPYATDVQRSLSWLAPELVGAGLTLVTEGDDWRKWAGVIDADTHARVSAAWSLEDGHRVFDGMAFETGGSSPIVYVSLGIERERAYAAA